jgi:glycine cleavage system H protein
MDVPADRRYSESHEWHLLEGDVLTLGLTQFAVDQLTDITYVEMKEAGSTIDAGDIVGEVESVKTTSDVYSALGGEIIEVNPELDENPALLNTDPHGEGWLVKIKVADTSGLDALMDAAAYTESHGS